jgi:queuine/archaeosine tRNA-ribosyltransferase
VKRACVADRILVGDRERKCVCVCVRRRERAYTFQLEKEEVRYFLTDAHNPSIQSW